MTKRVYLSNLSPLWPISRQEAMLSEALPGYPKGATVFRDMLDAQDRQARRKEALNGRASLLRKSSRGAPEAIYIASAAVLAWTSDDLMDCVADAASRSATVHFLDASLVIGPDSGAKAFGDLAKAFAASRQRQTGHKAGTIGGKVSAERRKADAKAKAEKIRERWGFPSYQYPTAELLAEAGISLNTAKLYLGRRSDAQRDVAAAMKRRAARAAKEKAQ